MCRLTRDGTAEPVSRDRILRHAREQGNIIFPCSADHEQDCQPYPVDPYSAICDNHTYIPTTVVVPGSTYYTVFYRKGLLVDLMVEADLTQTQTKQKLLLIVVIVVVVVVSHIQRIGCQPEKTTLHGGQSRSWSAELYHRKNKHFSARGKVHLVLDRKLMSLFLPVLSTCYHAITTSYQ